MECQETLTESGRGHWGDRPVLYALSTIRRTWFSRTGPNSRSKETFRFTFEYGGDADHRREFDTEAERSQLVAASIPDAVPSDEGARLLRGCRPEIELLLGDELEDVELVADADYLQLQFHGGDTSFYVWPHVRLGGALLDFDQPGYRDALCSFLGAKVIDADFYLDDGLVIRFESGELSVSPDQIRNHVGPEVVYGHAIFIQAGEFPYGGLRHSAR